MSVRFASIPSPSSGEIVLGPLHLRAYGLMIALGVLAAVWLAGRRLEARGAGTREDISYVALWAVPAGIIGSRIYHVITDWRRFEGRWLDAFKIWEGGLGIWGGIGLGVAVGIWAALRRGIPLQGGLSAITPALPLAQAIGRWGNWWNQELFGRPTDLPWALEVSPEKAVAAGYPVGTTFHPTFLYESLWCFFLSGALIWVDRRFRVWGTELFALYVAGYTFMRFWIERMRVDEASLLWGWRVNEVVSLVVFALALAYLAASSRRPRPEPAFAAVQPNVPVGEDLPTDAADEPAAGTEGAAELADPIDDRADGTDDRADEPVDGADEADGPADRADANDTADDALGIEPDTAAAGSDTGGRRWAVRKDDRPVSDPAPEDGAYRDGGDSQDGDRA